MRNKWQNLFCQAFRRFSVANAFVARREALIPTPVCLALGNPFSCKFWHCLLAGAFQVSLVQVVHIISQFTSHCRPSIR